MRLLVSVAAIALATVLAQVLGVNSVVTALLLLVAVVMVSMLGTVPGLVAAVLGGLSLIVVFYDPAPGVSIETSDDVVSLVVFVVIASLVGTLVSRERISRHQARLGQLEAQLRIDITNRLLLGEPTTEVVQSAAESIATIFDLSSCTLTTAGTTAMATQPLRPGRTVVVRSDKAAVEAVTSAANALTPAGEDVLAALTSAMGLVFVRADLERSANEARVDAEVNRARAAFFAAAGHNLRTPLTSVSASVAALLDSGDHLNDDEQAQLLGTIRDETARLERMVAKVLSQTRIRGADIVPDPEPVDLGGMVQVAIGRLGPAASDRHFDLRLPPDVGPLWLDVTMLEQILLNLLENAVRFAPDGSTITISAEQSGSHVDLRVVDHGPGVNPDDAEAIFTEFFRSGSRTEGEGTGLGLAIVAALVDAHNGQAWCEATPGGGATFVVRFPLAQQPQPFDGHNSNTPDSVGPQ